MIWEFRVKSGKRREFEKAYGPEGEWAEFFRRDQEYIRSDLIRNLETRLRYLTIDVWSSREAYLRFKKSNRREYDEIDRKCDSLIDDEVKIGEFYNVAGTAAVASLK